MLLICLIVLASIGLGISGGVPIPRVSKREDKIEVEAEELELETDKKDLKKN